MEKLILAFTLLLSPIDKNVDYTQYESIYPELKAAAIAIGIYSSEDPYGSNSFSFFRYENSKYNAWRSPSEFFVDDFLNLADAAYKLSKSPSVEWERNWQGTWNFEYDNTIKHIQYLNSILALGCGDHLACQINAQKTCLEKELRVYYVLWQLNQKTNGKPHPEARRRIYLKVLFDLIGPKKFYSGYLY